MRRITYTLITILSLIVILLWLHIQIGFDQILITFSQVNYFWFFPPFGLFVISYIIRTLRWNTILHSFKDKTEGNELFPILCGGTLMNFVLPFKMGELVRPFWLRDKGLYTLPQALSSIIAERFYDIVLLVLIPFSTSIFFFTQTLELLQQQITSTVIVIGAFIAFFFLIRYPRFINFVTRILSVIFKPSEKLSSEVPQFIESMSIDMVKVISDKKHAPLALIQTLPIWLLESSKLVFFGFAVGLNIPLEIALFVGCLSYVLGHVLTIPAGIGIFGSQLFIFTIFFSGIIPVAPATAIALLDVIFYVVALSITGAPSLIIAGPKKSKTL